MNIFKSTKTKVAALAALFVLPSLASAATFNADSFSDLKGVFKTLLGGSFGMLLAILGFAGTFFIYMFTHRGSILVTGFFISLLAGGIVAIAETAFNMGASTLQIHNK